MGSLIVLSGGQDSGTILLSRAKNSDERIEAVTFDYGQRHDVELSAANLLAAEANVQHHKIELPLYRSINRSENVSDAMLAGGDEISDDGHTENENLPTTYLPARNINLTAQAAAIAKFRDLDRIVLGVNQDDYSGYPDCRDVFIHKMQAALNMGMETSPSIETPLMDKSKKEIWGMAVENDIVEEIVELTHTCYYGVHDEEHRNPWGYGCGECPSCELRKKGFSEHPDL